MAPKGSIAAMVKPAPVKPAKGGHPHKNLGGYLHPKGGKC